MNNSEQPYTHKHHSIETWRKEEESLEPIRSVKFNESSNTESLQRINANPSSLGQIKMFNRPLTFSIFEEYKSEYIPSETSQEDDIKPVIVSNETTYSSSDEELPSSLKLKNI